MALRRIFIGRTKPYQQLSPSSFPMTNCIAADETLTVKSGQ